MNNSKSLPKISKKELQKLLAEKARRKAKKLNKTSAYLPYPFVRDEKGHIRINREEDNEIPDDTGRFKGTFY